MDKGNGKPCASPELGLSFPGGSASLGELKAASVDANHRSPHSGVFYVWRDEIMKFSKRVAQHLVFRSPAPFPMRHSLSITCLETLQFFSSPSSSATSILNPIPTHKKRLNTWNYIFISIQNEVVQVALHLSFFGPYGPTPTWPMPLQRELLS